ncbi:MAG: hypothetical protein Q4F57_03525 [Weeksellaceae bacterium]|nr:hypothetical protein [Weeksellaceae bacterium]
MGKPFTCLLLFLWILPATAQSVADYPYVIIPNTVNSTVGESLSKDLRSKNYTVILGSDAWPEDLRYNPCKGLTMFVTENNGGVRYSLKDCNDTEVLTSSGLNDNIARLNSDFLSRIPTNNFIAEDYVPSQETSVTIVTQKSVPNAYAAAHRVAPAAKKIYDGPALEDKWLHSDGERNYYIVPSLAGEWVLVDAERHVVAKLRPSAKEGVYHTEIFENKGITHALTYRNGVDWLMEYVANEKVIPYKKLSPLR